MTYRCPTCRHLFKSDDIRSIQARCPSCESGYLEPVAYVTKRMLHDSEVAR